MILIRSNGCIYIHSAFSKVTSFLFAGHTLVGIYDRINFLLFINIYVVKIAAEVGKSGQKIIVDPRVNVSDRG